MLRPIALVALAVLLASPVRGLEPWADRSLPVSDNLLLWLDAGRLLAACKAHGQPEPASGSLVGVCWDGSGNRLHLVQRQQQAQPHFVRAAGHAALRFDGQGRHLGLSNVRRRLERFTLFVVALPRSNAGDFRGLIAGNETGRRDYTSGFTVDLTGAGSSRFDRVNVEGKGFGGAVNLLDTAYPLGEVRTVEVVCAPGPKGVQLVIDGKPAGTRARQPGTMILDEITVAARFYTNEPTPGRVRGFFDGDIAEVLLFDRALTAAERDRVRAYLARKHAGLGRALAEARSASRVVANPPPVQVLVPGFAVRQLPVDLPNINNVRYRRDGKLLAVAYNGDVYLLSDSDGDGVEDRAELYWDNKGRIRSPIGVALTPPGFRHGQGVLIASKGKVSLLVEGKDGKAEREVIVASGWKELPHGVDALGVAVGKDGRVYFGLGTADFTNPYLLQGGKARYDPKGERGAVLEVAPDFRSRKVVATGLRFTVGLAFNRRGDLFATDQEGATWLPNGNPFDELLHVQPGRHYGFPPRHPRHLSGVIDEPSVYDYGPQHQSTCGLSFNEPVNGGPVFGPRHWRGDALVSGYSRGKLYRTQLAHSPAGYVARNHLLACLNMLAVDACVSPKGDLVVAVHSGAPDWGSGPGGKGKLYKISHIGKDLPQPVAAWAAGPRELRIAFDRAVEPALVRDVAGKAIVEYGPYVRAGDRFEALRPGYAVVEMQQQAPRRRLPVHSARLIDAHTLSLLTAPHPGMAHYAVTLPGLGRPAKPGKGELSQHAGVDLDYDLGGLGVTWKPAKGEPWSGWLPHLDLAVSKQLLAGSAAHAALWTSLEGEGTLTLKTKLDLWQMLRPAVQPGSKLDHAWPAEKVTLVVTSAAPFTLKRAGKEITATGEKDRHVARLECVPKEGEPLPVEVALNKARGAPSLGVSFFTSEDKRERALPLRRFLLPWAEVKPSAPAALPRPVELEGGNWLRGRRIFFSDQAACGKCHTVRGEGGKIGPDLSNLVHRDYQSVMKDIREPSAALNPDHVSYTIELDDGRVLVGVPRDGGKGKLIIGDQTGRETVVKRERIEKMTASRQSLMPEGLDRALGPTKMRDLMTFLLTEPLAPAPIERDGAPPPRSRAEVAKVLGGLEPPAGPGKRLRILLAAGPKDHGPGEHDYPLWQRRWFNLLSLADNVAVDMVMGWPGAARLARTDVVVFYSNNPGWSKERAKELEAFLARGGGAVYLHYAVDGHRAVDELARSIGLAWRGGAARFRHGALELTLSGEKSPITRGLSRLKLIDESYWRLAGDPDGVNVLATAVEEGKAQPLVWTRTRGKGRVFVSIPGHYNWTFDDPLFRLLVLRGLCWAAGEDADRLSELATVGARIGE
jgi:putative heme-binding domain-containing protein